MRLMVGVDGLQPGEAGAAITIGTFDGVHLGHRSLIATTISRAQKRGLEACGVTWDRHPLQTLRPDNAPLLLTSPERKVELLGETGLDALAVLPFDRELSTWPPERFVEEVLVTGLRARLVLVGEGWRFGHRAAGDVPLLEKLGEGFGFEVAAQPLESSAGEVVSSSRIRAAVGRGDLELAAALLGRPFDLDGVVVPGDARGKTLGFPTANLQQSPGMARPPVGVYACRARLGESWFAAAVNIGVNPTFEKEIPVRLEAHLLQFEGDLYGKTLRLEFVRRLRDEQKFDSVDELVAQIAADIEATRRAVDQVRARGSY